jgi:hypothetical protein
MGTRYYVVMDRCDCCKRGREKIMFCKNLRTFRAYQKCDTSLNRDIRSWQDWREVFDLPNVSLEDEYGSHHSVDDIVAGVEAQSLERRRRQYDAAIEHKRYYDLDPDRYPRDFLDPEGYSFHEGEFS